MANQPRLVQARHDVGSSRGARGVDVALVVAGTAMVGGAIGKCERVAGVRLLEFKAWALVLCPAGNF